MSRGWRRFRTDDRGVAPVGASTSPLLVLVLAVLGGPSVVALVGGGLRRANAPQYALTAVAALVAVFTLAATVRFATRWAVLGICAVLAAVGSHLWQHRTDRVDLLVVGGIYATPVGLAVALLVQALTPLL